MDKRLRSALKQNKKERFSEEGWNDRDNRKHNFRNNSDAYSEKNPVQILKGSIYKILSDADDARRKRNYPVTAHELEEAVDYARQVVQNKQEENLDEREVAKLFSMIYSRAKRLDKQVSEMKQRRDAVSVNVTLTKPITPYVEKEIRRAGYEIQAGVPVASRTAGITSIVLGILSFGILSNSTLTGNVVGVSQKNISGIGIIIGVLLVIAGFLFLQKRIKIIKK